MTHGTKFDWQRAITSEHGPDSPITRLVLLTLCTHMSRSGGSCFPSYSTLQEETGLSRSAVGKHLKSAREAGWIRTEKTKTDQGGNATNRYEATLPDSVRKALIEEEKALAHEEDPRSSRGEPGVVGEANQHSFNNQGGTTTGERARGSRGKIRGGEDPPPSEDQPTDPVDVLEAAFPDYSVNVTQEDRIRQLVTDLEVWRRCVDHWRYGDYNPWSPKLLEKYREEVDEQREAVNQYRTPEDSPHAQWR